MLQCKFVFYVKMAQNEKNAFFLCSKRTGGRDCAGMSTKQKSTFRHYIFW